MNLEEMNAIDPSGMYRLIKDFPVQAREAVDIGRDAVVKLRVSGIKAIVLSGLGGSAIGGDLLKSFLASELKVPFIVNRHYTLPAFVDKDTLVIISSYSGNTEETISSHKEAIKRKARILCITSGGKVRKLAASKKSPCIEIPGGLPPRAALAYSFFPLLITLGRLGLTRDHSRDIKETLALLDSQSAEYAVPDAASNQALQLARQVQNRLAVVYSSTEHFDAVNTRWRGQFAENAKTLLFGHVLPEMNHNELVGWNVLRSIMKETQVLILRDKGDHRRVQMRMDITKSVLEDYTGRITEVWSAGNSLLARMFSLVHLGDWVSYYLAILHGADPMPVAVIDRLKNELANAEE
jgi:glucose/mannose-6-phosphate isomerase